MSQRDGLGSTNQACRDRKSGTKGTTAYPQWGSEVERRDAARGALFGRRPLAGSECAVQHLPGSTVGQGVQERLGCPSRTARCCPLATEEVDESGEVLLLPLLFEPSSDLEMTETALLLKIWVPLAAGPAAEQKEKNKGFTTPALLRGKERCSHHLLKSSPNHLRVARPRASALGIAAPLGGGLDGLGTPLTTGSTAPLGWRLLLRRGSGGSRRGSPSATSRLRCCRRQSGCNSGPPGQDVANRLRLLLYSRELLGEVLDRIAKEAGLGHGGIKEPDFVGIPHVGQTQPEMAFLDHQSGQSGRPKREVRRNTKFVMNLWVMTTLVQVSQCLGLMDLQQRHSM